MKNYPSLLELFVQKTAYSSAQLEFYSESDDFSKRVTDETPLRRKKSSCSKNVVKGPQVKKRPFARQVTDVSQRNSSSGTSGSASSPSSGVSSQLTGSHVGNTSSSQAALAAQLVGQQLLMHGSLGALSPQEIQALASTLQQQQQSLQQQLQQQFAMFQANPAAAGQLPAQAQFFLQNQVGFRFPFCNNAFL